MEPDAGEPLISKVVSGVQSETTLNLSTSPSSFIHKGSSIKGAIKIELGIRFAIKTEFFNISVLYRSCFIYLMGKGHLKCHPIKSISNTEATKIEQT